MLYRLRYQNQEKVYPFPTLSRAVLAALTRPFGSVWQGYQLPMPELGRVLAVPHLRHFSLYVDGRMVLTVSAIGVPKTPHNRQSYEAGRRRKKAANPKRFTAIHKGRY